MGHFTKIADGINVSRLLAQMDAHPEIWNDRPERRGGNSPHRETSDVWYRYASPEAMAEPDFAQKPHKSVWWPAAKITPAVIEVTGAVRNILEVNGKHALGGILATRIPVGCQVYEHHDDLAWHARHYTAKVWLVLRGNDQCVNTVEDESMVWKPGEAWSHDNLIRHSARNDGESERLVLILCFRKL